MSTPTYWLLFISCTVLCIIILFFIRHKQNSHTELYSEGVRNENDGRYKMALRNYEDALSEIRKLKLNKKFGTKIAERIKILRTTIDYEQTFNNSRGV